MHEEHPIEKELRKEAGRISETYNGAPVIIVLGGSSKTNVPRCMIASTLDPQKGDRLRDLLGILQTAIQIESQKHLGKRKG